MPEFVEIVVSRSVRVNTGDYEGTEHFVSMKQEIAIEDDGSTNEGRRLAHNAALRLAETVEEAMVSQLVRSYEVRGKTSMAKREAVKRHHGLKGNTSNA